jgi:hypothetical protein
LRLRSEQANLALIDVEALALLEGAGPRPMLIEGGKASVKFTESLCREHYPMWGVLRGADEYYLREAVK